MSLPLERITPSGHILHLYHKEHFASKQTNHCIYYSTIAHPKCHEEEGIFLQYPIHPSRKSTQPSPTLRAVLQ